MTYLLAKALFSVFSSLDRESNLRLGELIGSLFWNAGYRKKVILKNLDIAFPEKDLNWKKKTGKSSLQNIGRTLTEFSKIPDYIKTGQIKDIFTVEKGREILEIEGGKIIITAHIGNWEIGGAGLSYMYGNVVSLAYRIKNKKLNQLITEIRESSGMKIIFHDQPLKDFLKSLKDEKTVVFLADQNALRHRGVFVDFFGLPASTVSFPAKLAVRYGVPVFFAYQYYDYETKVYRGIIKEINWKKSEDTDRSIKNLVQAYTKEIEDAVRKHPDQYFWVHKRWKTRPEGELENIYSD
ncbi:KDO2-lipid IV(A) lauroyltransferase [Persephonella hydrogeniphila]|uniref:KDO2-lipid IV(A) lauroyltransferase n=1 Tax=Persephonella hydrogeniphila TaxID=198703 RepID=A0A285N0M6_9AQUI|nr:lysophospholipid acyltransferase family protein [Persephonella hydrogeniphila]SNZ02992.1 KDO2-lipid IV(A) lauroyltransferase [Persephonella hydrogeniphila]